MRLMSSVFCFIMLALTWFNSASFAQVEQGDLEISFSGSLGWSETRGEGMFSTGSQSTTTRIGVGARVGYFVSRRVDVGGIIGASYSDFDSEWDSGFGSDFEGGDSYTVSIGPAVNFHFRPDTDIVPFIGAAAGITDGESNSSGSAGERIETYDGWFAEARGGADFFLTPHVAIKLQLRYRRQETEQVLHQQFQGGALTWNSSTDDVATLVGFAIFLDTKK